MLLNTGRRLRDWSTRAPVGLSQLTCHGSTGSAASPFHSSVAVEKKDDTNNKEIIKRLAETTGRSLDIAYTAIVHQLGITQRFFQQGGFGDLNVVNFHEDVQRFDHWPPAHFDEVAIDWKREKKGDGFHIFHGTFKTPCTGTAYDGLPVESRTVHVRWVRPNRKGANGNPTVVHLAATGDHGFTRRETLFAVPLAREHGIGSVILESPYYGLRKPAYQKGAKLRFVSDLLLLGRATIEETLFLLHWLRQNEGDDTKLGVSGLSMGGVHSCMIASLYPGDVALAPLLAPRSAASAYVRGALFHATGWNALMRDAKERSDELLEVVHRESRSSSRISASRALTSGNEKMMKATGNWLANWSKGLSDQMANLLARDAAHGSELEFQESVALLEAVLETYTDVTRFPLPRRADACVIVAATEDAYVSRESVDEMHTFLKGSELRWVPGGHVSSFVLHHDEFRRAIKDSMARLYT